MRPHIVFWSSGITRLVLGIVPIGFFPRTPSFTNLSSVDLQQKKRLLQTDRACVRTACVRTACVRPIRSVRSKCPPLRPVHPERPERPGVLGLHLLRLVPPNTLVPVLTTRRTCHGLIPSEPPPSVSSRPGVSRVDLPDSGSPMA